MQMPGRSYSQSNSTYRYGFNGKEKDKDGPIQYDYGFRIYDPRLVRFKSVDPLAKSYPYYTPYQFAGNSPIELIDIDGGEGGKLLNKLVEISDAITDFFTFKSEKEEIKQGASNITEGINKQVIGPWDWRYFSSENPGLDLELRRIDGQIQSTTGVVQISSGIQGISQKVQTVVEIPLILKNTSKPALKNATTNSVKSNVKPAATPQATKTISTDVPEWKGPLTYDHLPEPRNVGPAKKFTRSQHNRIMEHNKKMNDGVLRDDETGQILNPAKQDKSGVPSDMNSAQLDHNIPRNPKDKTVEPGTNSNANAKVRSKGGNIKKSNN